MSKEGLWGLQRGEERRKKTQPAPRSLKKQQPEARRASAQQAELARSHAPARAGARPRLLPFDGRG